MIKHTVAFDRARKQSQAFLDFAVLTCTAVPNLKSRLSASGSPSSTIPAPDYFKGVDFARVATLIPHYQEQLSRAAIVTLFSFFEAYVHELLSEIVDFHGGKAAFVATADRRTKKFLTLPAQKIVSAKRKLQEPIKKSKADKYRKYSKELAEAGYRFPSELMASLGVRMLTKKAGKNGFKAWEITEILEDALHFSLSAQDRKRLEDIRALRNTIAHGSQKTIQLKEAMSVSTDLHKLSARIDGHAVEHFFVLEAFV